MDKELRMRRLRHQGHDYSRGIYSTLDPMQLSFVKRYKLIYSEKTKKWNKAAGVLRLNAEDKKIQVPLGKVRNLIIRNHSIESFENFPDKFIVLELENCSTPKNLIGLPHFKGGSYVFDQCRDLISLEGAPEQCVGFTVINCSIKSIEYAPKCKKLFVTQNRITDLIGCPSCPSLIISCNPLVSLKGIHPDVTILDAAQTNITKIEESINVDTLDLSFCKIESFDNIKNIKSRTLLLLGNNIGNLNGIDDLIQNNNGEISISAQNVAFKSLKNISNYILKHLNIDYEYCFLTNWIGEGLSYEEALFLSHEKLAYYNKYLDETEEVKKLDLFHLKTGNDFGII